MNKIGRPTYLSNDKESLVLAAASIEGGHVLPLYSNYILGELQHVIKAFKFWLLLHYWVTHVTTRGNNVTELPTRLRADES